MRVLTTGILFLILVSGCIRQDNQKSGPELPRASAGNRYATRFTLKKMDGCTLVRVINPWQNSQEVTYHYVLGSDPEMVPDSLAAFPFIRTPVSRVLTLSTTHVAMVSQLGMAGSIKGASGTDFIFDSAVLERIQAGLVRELGYDQGLNYETIVALDPDVLFLYGVEGNVTTTARKLEEMGIRVVYCAEYLEKHPLGKAEWIRFFATFFQLEQESARFFNGIDSAYHALSEITAQVIEKPRVLTGLPWKDVWYVAGGQSFASKLIHDAGGDYLWNDHPSGEAIPMDLESVYSRAVTADIWINPGNANSIGELERFDERFMVLPPVIQGKIYNNNGRLSGGGGNDYWESGTVRPDLVLADLISVFHPDLLPDHSLFYYRKLK